MLGFFANFSILCSLIFFLQNILGFLRDTIVNDCNASQPHTVRTLEMEIEEQVPFEIM